MIDLPLAFQSGDILLAELDPDHYITDKKRVVSKLTAENRWVKPVVPIVPSDFVSIANAEYERLTEPYRWMQEYQKTQVFKHGDHDQSTHGRGRSKLSPSIADDTQRLTADWGGLSINMVDGSMPTSGFMVAKPPEFSKVVDAKDFFDAEKGPKILADYMKANKKDLASGKNYLGTWLNEGKVYLDVSENIMDRAEAVKLGQDRNQLAIYDVVGGDSINTGGTGDVGKRSEYSSNQRHLKDDRQRARGLRSGALGEDDSSEVDKHQAGQHDQSTHGGTKSYKSIDDLVKDGVNMQEAVDGLGGASVGNGNVAMRVLLERTGKGGKPEVVASVADLDGEPIYRGVPTSGADSLVNADYDRIGTGQYGDGYYFSNQQGTAQLFANMAKDQFKGDKGKIVVASWKKDAKVFSVKGGNMGWVDAATSAQNSAIDKLNINTRASDNQSAVFDLFYQDYGNSLVTDLIMQGFDGMDIGINALESYTVVFNREAMQVVGN